MESNWLSELKAGDTVIVDSGASYIEGSVENVEKVTATQIVVGRFRYRKTDGRQMGNTSRWKHPRLLPPNKDKVRNIRRKQLARGIVHNDLSELTLEQLETITAWVKEAKINSKARA
jgi:hypothetical protein